MAGLTEGNGMLMKYCDLEWPKEYEADYIYFLCLDEIQRKENYMMSLQKEYRPDLIKWMKDICQLHGLSILTLHLAAYVLDSFMDQYNIKPYRLRFIAACSLSLAAKFEENVGVIPSYKKMYTVDNPSNQPVPPSHIIKHMEYKIFKFMNCNLHIPTAAHFLLYFIVKGLAETDFQQRPDISELELRMTFRDTLQHFLDSMLEDLWSLKVRPSWIASASLIYARKIMGLQPEWPEEMSRLMNLSVENLAPALKIAHKYCPTPVTIELASPNDSGYSGSPDHSTLSICPGQAMTSAGNYEVPMSQDLGFASVERDTSMEDQDCMELFGQLGHSHDVDML